jgi:hypothetical protein
VIQTQHYPCPHCRRLIKVPVLSSRRVKWCQRTPWVGEWHGSNGVVHLRTWGHPPRKGQAVIHGIVGPDIIGHRSPDGPTRVLRFYCGLWADPRHIKRLPTLPVGPGAPPMCKACAISLRSVLLPHLVHKPRRKPC